MAPALLAVSAVYLLYLPHSLPVADDWKYLEAFRRAWAEPGELLRLLDNRWWPQFRIIWTSLIPTFLLSKLAGSSGWPYFLLAWAAHLASAALLARIVALLGRDPKAGFAAGAVYAVFPASNGALFWAAGTSFYYLQVLAFLAWFLYAWGKLGVRQDYRYRWRDAAALAPVVFSGEQILPAVALLPLVTHWLLGRDRRAFYRFWALHLAAMGALLGAYVLLINREPLLGGFQNRYGAATWSLRPWSFFLFGSLGLNPEFAGWKAAWRPEPTLLALTALAGAAFLLGWRSAPAPGRTRQPEVLLWAVAGGILTYLPLAQLKSFEWRYLYVSSVFLVPAGVAMAGRRLRPALALLAVAYGIGQTYFEMRQCWIPQSQAARQILAAWRPVPAGSILVVSGEPLAAGVAPAFLTGNSWSLDSMLRLRLGVPGIRGARDLVVNERGQLLLHNRDRFDPLRAEDLPRVRVFFRGAPRALLALPVSEGRYRLVSLSQSQAPAGERSIEELKQLPEFGEIYVVRRIHSHFQPTEL